MANALRRFSWGKSQKQENDEADVEVVEFFSAATTSEITEEETPKEVAPVTKKKKRVEEERVSLGGEETAYVVAGDVNLQTPPTKKRRMVSQTIAALETLIEVIADDEEVLSTRLEYCSNLWRFVREMRGKDVVEFVRQRSSSVVRVIEALFHTGYFPLQQLCFMTVAAILHQLHKKDTEMLAAFVVACNQSLTEEDVDLLELLPLRESIAWHDPRVARQRIVQINHRTGLCHSFRVSRCWVSPNKKQELARIRVNKWIDIGSTTTTFYWRDENDVVVVNVPHSCVEDVEIDRDNCVLYIWTKHLDRLKGVRLLAFASTEGDFAGLVKALVGVEIEGYTETPPSPSQMDFGSPIQKLKTASTLVLASAESAESPRPQSPATTVDDSTSFEPDVVEPPSPTSDGGSPSETLETELNDRLEEASRNAADSLDSLHQRLDASREALTDTFSRISSSHLESHEALAKREYEVRAKADKLQKKRLLDLPNAEFLVEDRITKAREEANTHMDDTLDYAEEHVPDEADFAFASASFVMLLIVVLPWVLFAVLHSGSDVGSVRQFAKDAFVLLAGVVRSLSG